MPSSRSCRRSSAGNSAPLHSQQGGDPDRRREHVVRRLRGVDVVVGMHARVRSAPTPRLASTSLTFMFELVPDPVWNTSTGNWSAMRRRRAPRSPAAAIASATSPVDDAATRVHGRGLDLDRDDRRRSGRGEWPGDAADVGDRARGLRTPQRCSRSTPVMTCSSSRRRAASSGSAPLTGASCVLGPLPQRRQAGRDQAPDVDLAGADPLGDLRLTQLVEVAQVEDVALALRAAARAASREHLTVEHVVGPQSRSRRTGSTPWSPSRLTAEYTALASRPSSTCSRRRSSRSASSSTVGERPRSAGHLVDRAVDLDAQLLGAARDVHRPCVIAEVASQLAEDGRVSRTCRSARRTCGS